MTQKWVHLLQISGVCIQIEVVQAGACDTSSLCCKRLGVIAFETICYVAPKMASAETWDRYNFNSNCRFDVDGTECYNLRYRDGWENSRPDRGGRRLCSTDHLVSAFEYETERGVGILTEGWGINYASSNEWHVLRARNHGKYNTR